jgi:hypothetical protein
MKKKILLVLLSLVVIYCCVWVFIAKLLESKTYEYLNGLKQEGIISEYSGSLSVRGFPFSFDLKFANPRIKFREVNAKLDTSCDILFDGIFSIDLGFFSDEIQVQHAGDLRLKGNINKYKFDLTIGGETSLYKIHLANIFILSAIKAYADYNVIGIKNLALELLNILSIHNQNLKILNNLTNKPLLYASEFDVRIEIDGTKSNFDIGYVENLYDAEFDKEFKVLVTKIFSLPSIKEITNDIDINIRNYFDVFSFDKLGKVNRAIDLHINVEEDDVFVNVNRFSVSNAAYNIEATGDIGLSNEKKFDLEFESKFSNRWHELMGSCANKLRLKKFKHKHFGKSKNSITSNVLNILFGFFIDTFSLRSNRSVYVPRLHEMGVVKGVIYITCKENNDGFVLDANKFQISTDRFKINASGEAENLSKSGGDKYNLKASITNYNYVVDSLVAYVNRISKRSGRKFFVSGKRVTISQAISNRIEDFLREISDNPEASSRDLSLTIVNRDGGKCPEVGGYSSKEFCAAWKSFVIRIALGEVKKALKSELLYKAPLLGLGVGTGAIAVIHIAKGVIGKMFRSNSTKK